MATVDSKTSIKIDDLINETVISGYVDSSGQLILGTRGGAEFPAGFVAKPFGGAWSESVNYETGDVVGYAGIMWKALSDNTNKPPALFTSIWTHLHGISQDDWSEKDPYFNGDVPQESWQFFWQGGSPVVSLTSVPGEFETGKQALKISCPIQAYQQFYQHEENIVRGGENIVVTVRAKLLSSAVGALLGAAMIQNDETGHPSPLQPGSVYVTAAEPDYGLTTSWETYTFNITAVNAKPRATVILQVAADAASAAVFLIDRVRITRSGASLAAWPVGSVFFSIVPTDPSLLLGGGTWARFGIGRMPISLDESNPLFDTPEETGGSAVIGATNLPPHAHTINHDHASASTSSAGSHDHTLNSSPTDGTAPAVVRRGSNADDTPEAGPVAADGAHTHTLDLPSFSGSSGNGPGTSAEFRPPFIAVYMWKRTA